MDFQLRIQPSPIKLDLAKAAINIYIYTYMYMKHTWQSHAQGISIPLSSASPCHPLKL